MTPQRRFTLLDSLVMVAALAGSLALFRLELPFINGALLFLPDAPAITDSDNLVIFNLDWQIQQGSWILRRCLLPLTIAVFILRLRQPRPRYRRLVTQPGFVACLMITLSTLAGGILMLSIMAIGGAGWWQNTTELLWGCSGSTLVGAWTLQGLGRRWKPEASWIDRAGRFLGVCWILAFVVPIVAGPWFYAAPPTFPEAAPPTSDYVLPDPVLPLQHAPQYVPPPAINEPPPTGGGPAATSQPAPGG
jgi:hypothetical protein